ncbi:hypothetical protein ACLBOM_33160 [Escherichia coli]
MEKNDKVHPMEEKGVPFWKTLKKLQSWGWYIISLATIIFVFNVHSSIFTYIFISTCFIAVVICYYQIDDREWTENYPTLEEYWRIGQIRKQKME